jgi:phosphatidylserine/phosphatidylglycerophosphate/cardiolipin synthase-like enzyme
MKKRSLLGIALVLLVALFAIQVAFHPLFVRLFSGASAPSSWEVYFSPRGGCTEAVVSGLGKAKQEVLVQAYSFTSAPIAQALVAARKRGVDVRVLLDKSQVSERYSSAEFLARAGIPVKIDTVHAIAHNKVMVIDRATVITGSFNFTRAAEERNAENLLVIHDSDLAGKYLANWQVHDRHSKAYVPWGI